MCSKNLLDMVKDFCYISTPATFYRQIFKLWERIKDDIKLEKNSDKHIDSTKILHFFSFEKKDNPQYLSTSEKVKF